MVDVSFYEGISEIWERRQQDAPALLEAMYGKMMKNREKADPPGRQPSQENWRHECRTHIVNHNTSPEKCLEKSVGMLAARGHMPGWCNQVPTASGITSSTRDKHANVDLMQWDESKARLRLIELKWESNTPHDALFQAVKCGLAYIFSRSNGLAGDKPCMRATHIQLQIVAPPGYFANHGQAQLLQKLNDAFTPFAASKLPDNRPDISVEMLCFQKGFRLPFTNGAEVKAACDCAGLTAEGRAVRDAFSNLASVWP